MSEKTSSNNCELNIHIKAPSQPKITVADLLSRNKLPNGTKKRVPCAFIIYRMSLQRELKSKGYKLSWPQVSSMAANAWNNESEVVKQEYINLFNDTKARYNKSRDSLIVENTVENNVDLPMTDVNSLNYAIDTLPDFTFENTLNFGSSFNNLIPPENYNTGNLEINNNLIAFETSLVDELKERISTLEIRLKLVTELLGIQF
jgi:hypothetical protein